MVGFNVIFNVFGVFIRLKVYVICVFNLFFYVIYNIECNMVFCKRICVMGFFMFVIICYICCVV